MKVETVEISESLKEKTNDSGQAEEMTTVIGWRLLM